MLQRRGHRHSARCVACRHFGAQRHLWQCHRVASLLAAAPVSISPSLLVRLERRICCKISVDEAVTGAGSRFSNTGSAGSRASAAAQRGASGLGRLLTAQALQAESPRYFLIDCRTKDEVRASYSRAHVFTWRHPPLLPYCTFSQFDFGGRLPTAFHFDPILFDDPELLDERMAVFKVRKQGSGASCRFIA